MTASSTPRVHPALPTDPAGLPPLGPGFDDALDTGLAALGVTITPGTRAAIEAHARLLVAWNAALNLTALKTPDAIARGHVVDSLAALDLVRREAPPRPALLDLGSGGGYPGLPLAAAVSASRLRLVDSIAKKARFLAVAGAAVADALRMAREPAPDILAEPARAEVLAARREERDAWDIVTCRAVGSLAEVAELGLPLLRRHGTLIAWKRDDGSGTLAAEVAAASPVVRKVGGAVRMAGLPGPELFAAAGLAGHVLVLVTKVGSTPREYPRSPTDRRRAC